MKTFFKCIFFSLLILKISNAAASNYIYSINGGMLSICSISYSTGHIRKCKLINPEHIHIIPADIHNNIGTLENIAISPDGAYAYIVTRTRDKDKIYTCLINNDTGYFEYCKDHYGSFPLSEYSANIRSITLNETGDKLYVLYSGSAQKSGINMIKICSKESETYDCKELHTNFTGITSIVISSDNKYAYLMSENGLQPENPERKVKFYACPINPEDGTFNYDSCHSQDLERGTINMAVTNKAIYFVIGPYERNISNIKYCPFEESDTRLGECKNNFLYDIALTPRRIIFDKANKNAYAFIMETNLVLRCKIDGSGFKNCDTKPKGDGRIIIQADVAAYRIDRPNDDYHQVTFHWKPHQAESR